MSISMYRILSVICLGLLVGACAENEPVVRPNPIALSSEHTGYFCAMNITEHTGPKAQIHVQGRAEPLWFTQVRDMFGFIMLPGEDKNITALYVTDMSGGTDWDNNNDGPWMDPKAAFFVVNSSRIGGMGAIEVVPFSVRSDAETFVQNFGGNIIRYGDVTVDYIFENASPSNRSEPDQGVGLSQ